ncbi:hypothetical protein, conserved [Eimeria necatrix]|uniref:Uncharacterized protein n=1 Tax=Eimeria necatrix TaxID=51315 RepID=U6MQE8_9EIME|nr:hypothetical protein, conserved [Eimeria necatrix]CDJ65303.1 hypothetical protein, conserved [Eimeria necatrix]
MTSAEPWVMASAVAQQQQAGEGRRIPSTPVGMFKNLQTQSVPAESFHPTRSANEWMGARAATEQLPEDKEWAPRTPPQLVVSIIGQLLKLLPDPPRCNPSSAHEDIPHKRESIGGGSASPLPLQEPSSGGLPTTPSAPVPINSQSPYSQDGLLQEHTNTTVSMIQSPAHPLSAPVVAVSLKINYAEYPCVFVVQSRDFQPYVQVRKSSQPAVHIYAKIPLHIEDHFDSSFKSNSPSPTFPGPLVVEGPSKEEELEGLVNPYIRDNQPTIFFHRDSANQNGQHWKPRICIDTTSMWWPSIQCTFASKATGYATSGFNAWGRCFAEEMTTGISISGPIKPLTMDLPY